MTHSVLPPSIPRLRSGKLLGHALALRDDPLGTLLKALREGGDLVRLRAGLGDVVVASSPALLQEVLVEKPQAFRKSRGLRLFARPITGTGLLVSEDPVHRQRRAVVAPTFTPARIAGYADAMVTETDRLLASLSTQGTCDLAATMTSLTLQIVATTIFRTDVAADVETVGRAFDEGSHALMALVRATFRLPPWFPTPARAAILHWARELDRIVYRIIRERRMSGEAGDDVLSRLLAARDPATGEGLDDVALRDEVLTLILAGHETTAVALSWSIALLGTHPVAARKLRDEVDRVLAGRRPTAADLAQLPYALAVFKEALRLYPPIYVMTRNTRAPMTLGGMRLRAGDKIFLSTFGVHRRPDLYPDPERFLPERFLDGAERAWPRSAYAPFGAGPRVCVGNHLAMMEGPLVLARLAQRLVLEHCVDRLPDPMPLVTLRPKQRIAMRVVPSRSQAAG